MVFKIAGIIENNIEAVEVESILKISVVGERGRFLGRLAFEETEALRETEELEN